VTAPDLEGGDNSATAAKADLEALLRRVENLEESRAEIGEDIKSVKSEAKAAGYDMKAFNAMLSLRKKDVETRRMIGFYADTLDIFG
jgi:uncharacterized protein (UPF0335 family)